MATPNLPLPRLGCSRRAAGPNLPLPRFRPKYGREPGAPGSLVPQVDHGQTETLNGRSRLQQTGAKDGPAGLGKR